MPGATAGSGEKLLSVKLRERCAGAHAEIERQLDIFRPGLTLLRYIQLLQRWLAFYAAWEPAAEKWFASRGNFFPRRSKIEFLQRDLAALGAAPRGDKCQLGTIEPTNYSTALGTLYVAEGSTLGGQIIAPRIGQLLSLTAENGAAFYHSYGSCIGEMWRETKGALDQAPVELHDHVIQAANDTFMWLGIGWLKNR